FSRWEMVEDSSTGDFPRGSGIAFTNAFVKAIPDPLWKSRCAESAIRRLHRLRLERRVHQVRRVGAEVHAAGTVPALDLNHADERQIVDRIDPEPGACRAAPVERSVAERQARALRIDIDREVET